MSKILITSDIHLTNKIEHEYRWGLFPWLEEQAIKYQCSGIIIAGDISDIKDQHTSTYVNRVVDVFTRLSKQVDFIYCLKGNHDYIEETVPYFTFFNKIPKLKFIIKPWKTQIHGRWFYFLPNTDDVTKWPSLEGMDYVITHQTYQNTQVPNGMILSGINPSIFDGCDVRVLSGDIHQPTNVNQKVSYIGSPYQTSYDDSLYKRIILLDLEKKQEMDLHFDTIRKFTVQVSSLEEFTDWIFYTGCASGGPKNGDQLKVKIALDNKLNLDIIKEAIKSVCQEKKLECKFEYIASQVSLHMEEQVKYASKSKIEVLEEYCQLNNLTKELFTYGKTIIGE